MTTSQSPPSGLVALLKDPFMPGTNRINLAFVASYPPRRCGIATFTHDLATAITQTVNHEPLSQSGHVRIVAMNDRTDGYPYAPEVMFEVGQHQRADYRNAADVLNTGKIDAVLLQHEYGLYGGEGGEYLFDLLDRLQVPLVSTLHTILSQPTDKQREVLSRICQHSSHVVVMANRARDLLTERYDVPGDGIRLIHHGVPDVPFGDTEPFKKRFGLAGRPTILTFGLLSPGKGIELMVEALAKVVPDCPEVAYIVLGVTHPGVRRQSGESYRLSLESRAVQLGIQKNVIFHNRYVSHTDLCEYLQAADLYVTPYRNKEQITSGTLAYALAAGTAIISTPYWHAEELLANGRGRLIDFDDVDALAHGLRELLTDRDARETIRRSAYKYGRSMIWPEVGRQYADTIAEAHRMLADEKAKRPERKVLLRMSLPEVRPDHLLAMTDGVGLLQHARYSIPDRSHGYSTDDNARAVIVTAMLWCLFQDESLLPEMKKYLSFLHYAQPAGGGRFRNFMSYDRRWFDQDGSDDCQGRALWGVGHLVDHAPDDSTRMLAEQLFRQGIACAHTLISPRSWALSILGAHYYLRQVPDDAEVHAQMATLADRLNNALAEQESDDWLWLEDTVTYDNGRIPQALIIAGYVLEKPRMVERGLRCLEWLLGVQTGQRGVLSIIGNDGWLRRSGERAQFDQQPLEPAALIGACKAAYRASDDSRWLVEMRRCFEWYLGRNDLGVSLIDFKTRGCCDGLCSTGANANQGAESVVSWLISLLIMHEMETGDAPDIG